MGSMRHLILAAATASLAVPAFAQSANRELLTQASFAERDRGAALRKVQVAVAATERDTSYEGRLIRATALGYRAKLLGSRSDLTAAKALFEAVVRANPRDPDAQLGLGAWHLATLNKTGGLLGRVFGANRAAGNGALDKAVALGGNHAFYPGLAALFRLKSDPRDPRGRQLAEQAARATVATPLDRIMQRAALAVLTPLRAGNNAQIRATAHRLLPFGAFDD